MWVHRLTNINKLDRACNVALGLVKDDPQTLRALALYMEKKHL